MSNTLLTNVVLYLAIGAVFGLASYPYRHLFGEGPSSKAHADPQGGLTGRAYWVAMCTCLWPVMLLSGAVALWKLFLARR